MLVESFTEGNSPLHTMDAAPKLAAATIFSICTALLTSIPVAGIALCIGCLLLLVAKLPLCALLRRLAFVNAFIVFLWLTLPFSTTGTALFHLGSFAITKEGVDLCILITLKSNAIISTFIALLATSSVSDIGAGLAKLKVPQKISLLLLFTWRYVHVILEEYRLLSTAATLRGFVPRTNSHTYKTYANLIAMVLVKSWDRAERVNHAMKLRGFTGTFHTLRHTKVHTTDIVFALLIATAGAGLYTADLLHVTELL